MSVATMSAVYFVTFLTFLLMCRNDSSYAAKARGKG